MNCDRVFSDMRDRGRVPGRQHLGDERRGAHAERLRRVRAGAARVPLRRQAAHRHHVLRVPQSR